MNPDSGPMTFDGHDQADLLPAKAVVRGVCRCRIFMLLLGLGGVFGALLLIAVFDPFSASMPMRWSLGVAAGIGVSILAVVSRIAWHDLVRPLIEMREWALNIRGGSLSSRLSIPRESEFCELAEDLNSIGAMLENQTRENERQLQLHTDHITQKNRSLQTLYDVAASVSVSRDLNDLLTRFLHNLKEVVGARAAAVRLRHADGRMHLVASTGLDDAVVERERIIPAASCLCGQAVECNRVLTLKDSESCTATIGQQLIDGRSVSVIAVPLQYRDRILGVYNLFVDADANAVHQARGDTHELLISIGRHLGMAIEKARLDEETHLLSIMEERTRLAHELHDSLAQTLASLRFQVRVLDETLHQDDEASVWTELERIENTLDEANTELRELIAHFRAPIDERGLVPAVEQAVQRFRREAGIAIFLQNEWPEQDLPADVQMQVLRIVQEALANIRKHSKAHAVRVLLQGRGQGSYRVLVEDDGVGLTDRARDGAPGEHIGLSILHDRAKRIGGKLRIESEAGEGTRVLLTFDDPRKDRNRSLDLELENEAKSVGYR